MGFEKESESRGTAPETLHCTSWTLNRIADRMFLFIIRTVKPFTDYLLFGAQELANKISKWPLNSFGASPVLSIQRHGYRS
jgi:hypothetical protein